MESKFRPVDCSTGRFILECIELHVGLCFEWCLDPDHPLLIAFSFCRILILNVHAVELILNCFTDPINVSVLSQDNEEGMEKDSSILVHQFAENEAWQIFFIVH